MTKDELSYVIARDKVFKCFRSSESVSQLETSKRLMDNFFVSYTPSIEVRITMYEHYTGRLRILRNN
jgi:hypothetical protein